MKNRTREAEVRGLDHLSTPKLKDRVNGEDNLEEREGFSSWVVLKDVFTSNGKEGNEFRSIREEIGTIEGGVGKQGWDVGVFDGSEVPEPPEIKSWIGKGRIWEGKVTGSRV